jgi:hypothetical protein
MGFQNTTCFRISRTWFAAACLVLFSLPLTAAAAQVNLQWDPNDCDPEGYRLFQRSAASSYDYSRPVWTGSQTSCTLDGLDEGVTYFFVVRAYDGSLESGDSNEVSFKAAAPAPIDTDSDGDGVIDSLDAFVSDASEWKDTDQDGTGDNADSDDDNDGMPDLWEARYGLDPLVDDADDDLDGDGLTNGTEYQQGSDPGHDPDNIVPLKPVVSQPAQGATVGLLPVLVVGGFADDDGDRHARTHYQISTFEDFSALTFEVQSQNWLTSYPVQDLILDPDTVYYWRACFYDDRNGQSDWSDVHAFVTIGYDQAGDSDGDGVLDAQQSDGASDMDADGRPDGDQADMLCVRTDDPINPLIGVKSMDEQVQVVSAQALDLNAVMQASADFANQPEWVTGLISFKLYLPPAVTTAAVTVFFSEPAPDNAQWYKFDPETGWSVFADAVFSADRRSISLVLEDGGNGDQDGVQNGVIVDPSGLGYSRQTDATGSSGSSGSPFLMNNGCFISNAHSSFQNGCQRAAMIMILIAALSLIGLAVFARELKTRR